MLWKGVFSYSCETIVKYTHAPTEKSAKMRMINQIAKEHEVHPSHVYGVFDGSKANFVVKEEK
jgi:hypothetical protein